MALSRGLAATSANVSDIQRLTSGRAKPSRWRNLGLRQIAEPFGDPGAEGRIEGDQPGLGRTHRLNRTALLLGESDAGSAPGGGFFGSGVPKSSLLAVR